MSFITNFYRPLPQAYWMSRTITDLYCRSVILSLKTFICVYMFCTDVHIRMSLLHYIMRSSAIWNARTQFTNLISIPITDLSQLPSQFSHQYNCKAIWFFSHQTDQYVDIGLPPVTHVHRVTILSVIFSMLTIWLTVWTSRT